MHYGYARVSSRGQKAYGTSLEQQEAELRDAGATEIFKESYTGTKLHRPRLDELLKVVQSGDTVYVTKLDRMARSVKDGIALIDELLDRGVNIHVLNIGKFDTTPTGKLMRTILLAFAEFERDMIVVRTLDGKAAKRAADPNWREGRKTMEIEGFMSCYRLVKAKQLQVNRACEKLGISRSTWYNRVRAL